jgi:hypothetical protein
LSVNVANSSASETPSVAARRSMLASERRYDGPVPLSQD